MIESDFDSLAVDLTRQAYDDTLDVYRQSPTLFEIQRVQIDQAQELHDAMRGTLWARTLDGAIGAQLDVIGRIVGLYPRPTQDAAAIIYFGTDSDEAGTDSAPTYVTGAPLAGQIPLGDVDYRSAIRVKIAKNHIRYGSPAELAYFARQAWGITLSARNVGLSNVEVTVPTGTAGKIITAIMQDVTDATADHQYGLPVPTTSFISRVMLRQTEAFTTDNPTGAIDTAPIGVAFYG
jgi:hypothetical protein